ncbi:CheR family methyltransferase [Actinokineospora sp. 24-640]
MSTPPEPNHEFEKLLTYLKDSRGFDFTGYKRTSLARRVLQRMTQVDITEYGDYIDHLQANPGEFDALFNTILINVTSFFRDSDAWEYLRSQAIPEMLAKRAPDDPIRVWSAGCAAGQEAYTLAMVLVEELGAEQFRQRVKIYATDVDADALAQARAGAYSEAEVAGVPEDLLGQYFDRQGGAFVFRKDLRRSVIFGRNDLVQDAPISRIDLLVCRNTMMYFNAATQAAILSRLHFALAPDGLLFLGKAEMLLSHGSIFEPTELKRRVFRKSAAPAPSLSTAIAPFRDQHGEFGMLDELREHAFAAGPIAQLVVTGDDTIAMINQQAELYFGLSNKDIGRPLRDLEMSYRPVELRTYLDQAKVDRRAIRVKDIEWQRGSGAPVWLEISLTPLANADNGLLGVSVAFRDVTAARALLDELEHANRQLEAAYEELQSTNEELETTNEELQSTVEELETTNEELQSTNEELETMNEELQSTNDELQAINDALRERSLELDEVNDFLESVLTSIRSGVVVVDRELRVRAWNRASEDLWGLRHDEARGEHLLNLDIGLPVADLPQALRSALGDPQFTSTTRLDAINRRGRPVSLRLVCGALHNGNGAVRGAILLMDVEHAG